MPAQSTTLGSSHKNEIKGSIWLTSWGGWVKVQNRQEKGRRRGEGPALPTQPRDTAKKPALIRLSFAPHNSLEANGKSAPHCKYLSKHPHRLVNGYDTGLQIGNAQLSQLGPNSRNINLPWPEKDTDVCSLHRSEGRGWEN